MWCVAPRHLRPTTDANYLAEAFLYNFLQCVAVHYEGGNSPQFADGRVNQVLANNANVLWVLVQVFLIADWKISYFTFCG